MVTVTCDMCGKRISSLVSQVDLQFTYSGVYPERFKNDSKQLCDVCANRLINWMDNQTEKGGVDNA